MRGILSKLLKAHAIPAGQTNERGIAFEPLNKSNVSRQTYVDNRIIITDTEKPGEWELKLSQAQMNRAITAQITFKTYADENRERDWDNVRTDFYEKYPTRADIAKTPVGQVVRVVHVNGTDYKIFGTGELDPRTNPETQQKFIDINSAQRTSILDVLAAIYRAH
jgi:hypothetical protein